MDEHMKRLQRCCFTGHRPEKLRHDESFYIDELNRSIRKAVARGYRTFISGMARGIDIWAAEQVLAIKREIPELHLICAIPHPDFEKRWIADWQRRYQAILNAADLTRLICPAFSMGSYQIRNEWMIRHSSLVIAVYNGSAGGTRNTINYARKQIVEVVFIEE